VRSPRDGQLKKLLVGQGANVGAGEVLAIIE
jgi:biotin carboxyl carrier protein